MSLKGQASSAIWRKGFASAGGTFVSRLLGFARDLVLAALFPVEATDLFFNAFTIPNALRGLLAEGATSAAFVPVYSEIRERQGKKAAIEFAKSFRGFMCLVLVLVSLVGVLVAPLIAWAYGAGFAASPERFECFTSLIRLLFPYILLMGLAALDAGLLNAEGSFFLPALAPLWLNVGLISAALLSQIFAKDAGLFLLAGGALLGGLLHLVFQCFFLRFRSLPFGMRFWPWQKEVFSAFALLLPLVGGLGIYQLNVMSSRLLASFLSSGALSYFYYAQRLVEIPQGMFGVAFATASLASFSELRAREDKEALRRSLDDALSAVTFIALPCTALYVAMAFPLIRLLFVRGAFEVASAWETSRSLLWQSLGIWATAALRVLVPVFHAHRETRWPLLGSAANFLVFLSAGFALSRQLGHVGLAMALSLAAFAQLGVLLLLLKRLELLPSRAFWRRAMLMGIAASGGGWTSHLVLKAFDLWQMREACRWPIFGVAAFLGLGVFVGLSWAFQLPEPRFLLEHLGRLLGLNKGGRGAKPERV
ncbi:MAG: murein biosynthesis integral membrane protein MurJ [Sandaracinaceae bacterium]|nr:murein biosynthesis integral membrane protein MurJ [Sandaracinaceae bacterium]